MKQIFLKDIFGILRLNEYVYLYESPDHLIGSFRVDRMLAYFSNTATLNREVQLIEATDGCLIYVTLKSDKEKEK